MTATETDLFNCPAWCIRDHIADLDVELDDGLDQFTLIHTTGAQPRAGARFPVRLERWDVEGKVGATEVNISIRGDTDLSPDQARELAAELLRLADLAEQT